MDQLRVQLLEDLPQEEPRLEALHQEAHLIKEIFHLDNPRQKQANKRILKQEIKVPWIPPKVTQILENSHQEIPLQMDQPLLILIKEDQQTLALRISPQIKAAIVAHSQVKHPQQDQHQVTIPQHQTKAPMIQPLLDQTTAQRTLILDPVQDRTIAEPIHASLPYRSRSMASKRFCTLSTQNTGRLLKQ